ncbi:hypothetical protein Pcinc_004926 [Petrolisthes cinctipes]|uniref:Uncharacterized protein n=1 Tax=Petrolisthes cinctipes TaxID=88211 RepID=A0AAE1GDL3_PETCI|nr:hypothetical protein Pcinc_004926 [Petrolisthes cinctipes]
MKSLLILLLAIALTRSQDEPECKCRSYVHVAEGELDVLDFPSNMASSCSAGFECAGFCGGEWTLLTNDGDLNHIMLDGITVGQHMCTKAASSGYNEISSENPPSTSPSTLQLLPPHPSPPNSLRLSG